MKLGGPKPSQTNPQSAPAEGQGAVRPASSGPLDHPASASSAMTPSVQEALATAPSIDALAEFAMGRRYGYDETLGTEIKAPSGWRILAEGEPIPQVHREYGHRTGWCEPRRCHSTMTPIEARPWGYVRAFAVPEPLEDRLARIPQEQRRSLESHQALGWKVEGFGSDDSIDISLQRAGVTDSGYIRADGAFRR